MAEHNSKTADRFELTEWSDSSIERKYTSKWLLKSRNWYIIYDLYPYRVKEHTRATTLTT